MKRLAVVALLVAGFALPMYAQRTAGHGGYSGHSAQAYHGGSIAAPPGRGPRSSGFSGVRSPGRLPISNPGFRRRDPGNPSPGPRGPERDHHRMPYRPEYGVGIPYLYPPWIGGIGTGYLGYSDNSGSDDSQPTQAVVNDPNASGGDYNAPPPDDYSPELRRPYQPSPGLAQPPPAQLTQEAVTLVFKDGRPSEQVHNYILTPTTLFIQDQQRRTIPTDQLDLVATAKASQDAGVDFQLPSTAR